MHPRSEELGAALTRCSPFSFNGRVIRLTGIDYANGVDLLSGGGSLKHGGRYNAKGGFRAIYASFELDTATAELLAHHRRQGRPDPDADVFPFVAVSMQIAVERLLDLTDKAVRRALKIKIGDLTGDWQGAQNSGREALTQALGRLAWESNFQGLKAPSAAKRRGRNVVLFRDKIQARDLEIIGREKLFQKPKRPFYE